MDLGFLSPPALFFQHFPPNLILSAGVLDFFFPFCLHGVALPFLVCHVLDPDLDGPWLGCQRKALNDSPFPSADLFPSTAGAGRGHSMPVFFSSTALISILSFAFSDLWLPPSPLPPPQRRRKGIKIKTPQLCRRGLVPFLPSTRLIPCSLPKNGCQKPFGGT